MPRPLTQHEVLMLLARLDASRKNWEELAKTGPAHTSRLAAERVKVLETVEEWFEELFANSPTGKQS